MNRRRFLQASSASTAVGAGLVTTAPLVGSPAPSGRAKVLVPVLPAEQLAELKAVAPEAELVACRGQGEALAEVEDADASYGFLTPELVRKGRRLRWAQQPSAGVEHIVFTSEMRDSPAILTNMQRAYAPEIADQAIGYLLAFTRRLDRFVLSNQKPTWPARSPVEELEELGGKTLLVVGLGGIGTEVARRAFGFGMTVLATDPKVHERPLYVAELHRPGAIAGLYPRADVVVSAAPLTPETRRMFNAHSFGAMKTGALFINVSRGGLCDTAALVAALDSGRIAAAGLDVTDPEPLTDGHALWSRRVIITPHSAGQSPGGERRRHLVFKENLRRFVSGEALLNVVDKKVGY